MVSKQLRKEIAVALVLALTVMAIIWPRAGARFFSVVENFGSRLARRKVLAVIFPAGFAILFRVLLLPVAPIPSPSVEDEFSYLLAADTFAHGRLSNPPHPMWIYFDTFHVNQHPTYMSKYPPAQGAILAIGQLLGHPWVGVLLSAAAMVAAIVWALQAWLPPQWAFLGGMLALLRLGISGYWIDSYWGGAVAALGGALVVGAVGRIVRFWRPRDAVILGLGEALLANSRPFEGLIFSLPVFAYLLFCLFQRRALSWRSLVPRFVVPFAGVILLCGSFMLYYNQRGTGNPFLSPYTLNSRQYLRSTPVLLWQKPATPQAYGNPQLSALYNGWARDTWQAGRADSVSHAVRILRQDIRIFVAFFLWPELCLPLLTIFWILIDRRVRLLVVQMLVSFAGFLLAAWFQPHYAAPLTVTVFALLAQGLRHLRTWEYKHRPIGVGLTRAIVLSAVLLAPLQRPGYQNFDLGSRAAIADQLLSTPGNHLVVVHYLPRHDSLSEWVYNGANIDSARIVWAREIPGVDLSPLLNYFRGRHVWVVDVDSPSPELRPYHPQADP
jgi:hypothetical protein